MGAGISSLRLRKAIVIRAYNLRKGNETLEEQFRSFAWRGDDGIMYISLLDIKSCLCFAEISWADDMIKRLIGDSARREVLFAEFVDFLETGQAPSALRGSQSEASLDRCNGGDAGESMARSNSAAAAQFSASSSSSGGKKKRLQRDFPVNKGTPAPGRARSKELPPHPPRPAREDEGGMSRHEKALALAQTLGLDQSGLRAEMYDVSGDVLDAPQPDTAVVLHPRDACRSSPSSSVWRKRELVRQERTVQYTTIDANGMLQELVEKETSETEVLHMESRETGEFAHRETTVYEQRETFNDEVVGEQHGVEEYVHLKSKDDEFEYMESTMPKKGAPKEQGDYPEPQLSPRVNDANAENNPDMLSPEELDEETLAFLQYQQLQQQYEQEELARRAGDGGQDGGRYDHEHEQYDQGEEDFHADDLPRSWWHNHQASSDCAAQPRSHLDDEVGGADTLVGAEETQTVAVPATANFEDID